MSSSDFARPRSDSGPTSSHPCDAAEHGCIDAQLNETDQASDLAGAEIDDDDNAIEGDSLVTLPSSPDFIPAHEGEGQSLFKMLSKRRALCQSVSKVVFSLVISRAFCRKSQRARH